MSSRPSCTHATGSRGEERSNRAKERPQRPLGNLGKCLVVDSAASSSDQEGLVLKKKRSKANGGQDAIHGDEDGGGSRIKVSVWRPCSR